MKRLIALAKEKCPSCEKGDVFKKKGNILKFNFPVMNERCPNCKHKLEIEPGYFYGAMFVSYGLIVAEMFVLFVLSLVLDCDLNIRLAIIIIPMVLLGIHNFRYSRMIWMYIFTRKK